MSGTKLVDIYDFYWNQNADPRTNDLPLIGSPIIIPSILFLYLYVVLKYGPEFMETRKPYNLKTFVRYYNVFQIVVNGFVVQQFISAGWFTEITVYCELPDYSYNPSSLKISYTMWLVTMLKLIDLVETFVFVLRKKYKQISFLHVYHHVTTILLSWLSTKYVPVAMASFTMMLNCSVHVIMYIYYFLSTFGPKIQSALARYKPILTIVQMVQFVILFMQTMQSFLPSCPVTKIPGSFSITNLIINFILFYNFYQKQYVRSAEKKH
ncbi:hypothetical protein QLX08_011065 [Tetragonisca angustula]|uniref:Elongation of very long chain fatty acids protein n=1 Tax=Tetragonisca angustula TaxID=166442 RepID=A0AAW0Z9P6_9HYME